MILRFMEGPKTGKTVSLGAEKFTIGRGEDCSLLLELDGVSRQHCCILQEDGAYYAEDMGSTNGVLVNGKKIEERTRLETNDKLRVGKQLFLFTNDSDVLPPEMLAKIDQAKAQNTPVPAPEPEQEAPVPTPPPRKAESKINGSTGVLVAIALAAIIGVAYFVMAPGRQAEAPADSSDTLSSTTSLSTDDDIDTPIIGTQVPPEIAEGEDLNREAPITPELGPVPPRGTQPAQRSQPVAPKPVIAFKDRERISYHWFRSKPSGAQVHLNGKVIGVTPCLVRDIATGAHNVTLRKDGYRDQEIVVRVPSDDQDTIHQLIQKAGTCLITSSPTRAAVMYGSRVVGETPYLIRDLDWAGRRLTVNAVGYQSQKVEVRFSTIAPSKSHVELRERGGSINVVALPGNGKLYIDGLYKGTIPASLKGQTEPFRVKGIKAGVREVYMMYENGDRSDVYNVKVERGRTATAKVTVFQADTEVITRDKKIIKGMFRTEGKNGDIVLAVSAKSDTTIEKSKVVLIRKAGEADDNDEE